MIRLRRLLRPLRPVRRIGFHYWKYRASRRFLTEYQEALDAKREIRLHVAAGGIVIPGWLNTDVKSSAPLYLDAIEPFAIASNSVEYVFCEHFIEHLTYQQGIQFFKEVARILSPTGVFRISTTSLEDLCREYCAKSQIADRLVLRNESYGYQFGRTHSAILNKAFYADKHNHIYDHATLVQTLQDVGFSEIVRTQIGESTRTALLQIERHHVGTILDDFMLVVECTKS